MTERERNDRAVAVSEARRYLERHGGQAAPGGVEMIDLLNAFFPDWKSREYSGPHAPMLTPAEMGWHCGTTGE